MPPETNSQTSAGVCLQCEADDGNMITLIGGDIFCGDCIENDPYINECYECGMYMRDRNTWRLNNNLQEYYHERGIPYGENYCRDCHQNLTFDCAWCENESRVTGGDYGTTEHDEIICDDCVNTPEAVRCHTCGVVVHEADAEYLDNGNDNYSYCQQHIDEAIERYENRVHRELESYSTRVDGAITKSNTPGDIVPSLRAYGVEIECYAPDRSTLKAIKKHQVADKLLFKRDGSLNSGGVEIVTEPIAGDIGENIISTLSGLLIDNNFSVDHTCGLHVHIDMSDVVSPDYEQDQTVVDDIRITRNELDDLRNEIESLISPPTELLERYEHKQDELRALHRKLASKNKLSPENINTIKKLMAIYIATEGVMMSFVPATRRSNQYCRPYAESYDLESVMSADSLNKLEELQYNTQDYRRIMRYKDTSGGNNTKYRGINFHSMFADGHYEVRMHTGTINGKKILHWIALHTAIADFARKKGMSCIENLMSQPNIKKQTEVLFECLDLPDKTRRYLKARQQKFAHGDLQTELYHDEIDHLLDGIVTESELESENY